MTLDEKIRQVGRPIPRLRVVAVASVVAIEGARSYGGRLLPVAVVCGGAR